MKNVKVAVVLKVPGLRPWSLTFTSNSWYLTPKSASNVCEITSSPDDGFMEKRSEESSPSVKKKEKYYEILFKK